MKTQAVLEWRDGLPYSPRFGDTYFSVSPDDPQHGLAETRHVFLQHNQLESRWQALPAHKPTHFTIVETGFGSGLNVLAVLSLWRDTAPASAHLHIVSVEIAPFSLEALQRAHQHFPALADISQALCAQYRLLQPGFNLLELPQFRVSLYLYIGDTAECLPQLQMPVDAWFLDGFAPSKNPEMWQSALFEAMARTAKSGTTFATFTSAGMVKRSLQAAGFQVQKVAGYGRKREMLCGVYPQTGQESQLHSATTPHIAVIGAGIAGCSTAWQLAQLGCQVTVFERAEEIASGASGNPRGMLYPRLNAEKVLNDQLALRAYSYSLRHYRSLGLSEDDFRTCGVLQLGGSPRELKRVHKVSRRYADFGLFQQMPAAQASTIAGVPIAHDSLWFADGGWVNPQAACQRMLQHANIQLKLAYSVTKLANTADQDNKPQWQLTFADGSSQSGFAAVIVCTAADARQLLPDSGMSLNPVRGQMAKIPAHPDMQTLNTVLCGDGYLTPVHTGAHGPEHTLGATFSPGETACDIRDSDNQANLQMLTTLSPQFAAADTLQVSYARASLRCGTPDYVPYVGPVLNTSQLQTLPHTPANHTQLPPALGLYVHVGHGSKGLLTAPYCAALLARRVCEPLGWSLPEASEDSFWYGLHPQRDLFKQLGWKSLWQPFQPTQQSPQQGPQP